MKYGCGGRRETARVCFGASLFVDGDRTDLRSSELARLANLGVVPLQEAVRRRKHLALPRCIEAHQSGEPGLVSALQLTDSAPETQRVTLRVVFQPE